MKLWQLTEANSFRSLIILYVPTAALTHISNILSMQKTAIRANLPTVALIKGEESPMLFRHSLLMKSVTPLGKLWKCAFTLFFKMRPLKERVGSSAKENTYNVQSTHKNMADFQKNPTRWKLYIEIVILTSLCLLLTTPINSHSKAFQVQSSLFLFIQN